MTADLLRRAAKEMRAAAQGADKQYTGLWHDEGDEVLDRRGEIVAEVIDMGEVNYLTEHIASWHPAVAFAVADWLDNEAGHYDATVKGLDVHPAQAASAYTFPLAVARAYLGETP